MVPELLGMEIGTVLSSDDPLSLAGAEILSSPNSELAMSTLGVPLRKAGGACCPRPLPELGVPISRPTTMGVLVVLTGEMTSAR
jgi:hypothetical protein